MFPSNTGAGDSPLRGRVSVVEPGAFTKVSALGVEEQRVKVRVDFLDSAPSGRELGDPFSRGGADRNVAR